MNEHETALMDYLTLISGMEAMNRDEGLCQMILRRGEFHTPAPLPDKRWRRPLRQCFHNSERLAEKRPHLRYAEGFAISGNTRFPFAFHHAWNVTDDGLVVDSTWVPEGLAYFGIVLDACEIEVRENLFLTALGVFA